MHPSPPAPLPSGERGERRRGRPAWGHRPYQPGSLRLELLRDPGDVPALGPGDGEFVLGRLPLAPGPGDGRRPVRGPPAHLAQGQKFLGAVRDPGDHHPHVEEERAHGQERRLLPAVLARGRGERAPDTHRPPVASRNARIWAAADPYRVGDPRTTASASASRFGSATGTCANAFRAAVAPIFSSTSAGSVSATWNSSTSAPASRAPSATASASR